MTEILKKVLGAGLIGYFWEDMILSTHDHAVPFVPIYGLGHVLLSQIPTVFLKGIAATLFEEVCGLLVNSEHDLWDYHLGEYVHSSFARGFGFALGSEALTLLGG